MIIEKKIVIKNKSGLHARPAAIFVQIANKFDCSISVKLDNQKINGKSILGILTLGADRGRKILLKAEGLDSEAAIAELEKLLSGYFDDTLLKESIPRTKKRGPEKRFNTYEEK